MFPSLRALAEAGLAESAEEQRAAERADPAKRKRRDEAIARLEEQRRQKPRKRNYEDRKRERYEPEDDAERDALAARLAEPRNARCCRHFFTGEGCTLGTKCRFAHVLS